MDQVLKPPETNAGKPKVSRLPNEIIDLICKHVDSFPQLRELRHVSRAWNEAAIPAIYSDIEIRLDLCSLMRFELDFLKFDSVASYVRNISLKAPRTVRVLDTSRYGYIHQHQALDERPVDGILLEPLPQVCAALIRVLRMLPKVKTFEFDYGGMIQAFPLHDAMLREATFSAVNKCLPLSLTHFIFRFWDKLEASDPMRSYEELLRNIMKRGGYLEVQIPHPIPNGISPHDDQMVPRWFKIEEPGLKGMTIHQFGIPFEVKDDMSFSFHELTSLNISNMAIGTEKFIKSIGNSPRLATLKLNCIRLSGARPSSLFKFLQTYEPITTLSLHQLIRKDEWSKHLAVQRARDGFGDAQSHASANGLAIAHTQVHTDERQWPLIVPPAWDIICSENNQDLYACQQLLQTMNMKPRGKNQPRPFRALLRSKRFCETQSFHSCYDWKNIQTQSEWLLIWNAPAGASNPDVIMPWKPDIGGYCEGMTDHVWDTCPLLATKDM